MFRAQLFCLSVHPPQFLRLSPLSAWSVPKRLFVFRAFPIYTSVLTAHKCTNMSLIMKVTRQIGVYLFDVTVHRLPHGMSAKAKVKTTYLFLCLSIHSSIYLKQDFILVFCFLFILFLYLLIKLTTTQLNYGCR